MGDAPKWLRWGLPVATVSAIGSVVLGVAAYKGFVGRKQKRKHYKETQNYAEFIYNSEHTKAANADFAKGL